MRLLPLALLSTAVAASDIESRSLHCAKGVHVIALPGLGTTKGDMGYMTTLVHNITRRIPHSNYEQIGYPEGATPPQVLAYAIPKLRERLAGYTKKCPKTKIVLASYSIGASANMDVICGNSSTGADPLDNKYYKNLLANVVYGDVTFTPGQPYDRGTCTASGGLAERQFPKKCAPYGSKTISYCDFDDVNCCSGHNQAVHFEYPEKYDLKAAHHVKNLWRHHLQVYRKHHPHAHKHHHKGGKKHHHKGGKKHHHKGGKKHHHKGGQ